MGRESTETHSSLLLLGVQSLVAEGALPRELVVLHWFSQNEGGMTEVKSAELDETGAFKRVGPPEAAHREKP